MGTLETQTVTVNRFGLTEVHSSRPADVDVVFVHGLNGDPHNTWTSQQSKVFWPAQLLPSMLEDEKARILVYGYDADITSFTDGVTRDRIHNHAEHLVAELAANRRIRKATERPIIFVAHSLGGLVVKRALIYSYGIRGPKTEHLRSIYVSTFGILFLGTPHKGSDVAQWGSRLEWICSAVMPKKVIDSTPQLVDALKTGNETLQLIDRQFMDIISRYHIYFFHEAKPTNLKGTLRFIVDEESASPSTQDVERASIQADHSHMCKFEDENSPGFDLVVEGIQRYAQEAQSTVKTRWDAEMETRNRQTQETVKELQIQAGGTPQNESRDTSAGNSTTNLHKDYHSLQTSEIKDDGTNTPEIIAKDPYFIIPPGFRANTFFVGMEKELIEIDRRLFDKRRRDGTACILLHGIGGGGKSHLARQYVNKNRNKFTGGVFWIIAKLKEERYQAFWNIYQKVVLRESPDLCTKSNGTEFVEIVKAWFEERQEWLIVFDGVTVEKDQDVTELMRFVPDSRNSSLIYISRAKNLESKQRLLKPFPIKVPPLKEEDGRKLLFEELRLKNPSEAEIQSATEWVRKVGGLPLAIDAISHRLSDTREPLTKLSFKSYSTDPKIGFTYNKIFDDLQRLGYMEASNLINILSFFGQHIPVEMVHLGLKSLRIDDVEVKSRDGGGKPDINATFFILMRYALLERNEPDDKDSMSSSRDSLVDPEPIDMLKLHSVVQKFCSDSLNAKRLLPDWLGYAVRLFICSYHQADIRIKQKPEPGRVSDYREYLVHGQKLWDNCIYYETKSQQLTNIREKLKPVLAMVNEEIRLREPNSSQESVNRAVFQISIFDRTCSSSESAESEPLTPDHRPHPLPLPNENRYGIELSKAPIDSPTSLGTNSPVDVRIIDNSPIFRHPPFFHDDGYDSDREGLQTSTLMQKTVSDATARPRASSVESQGEGWQVVASNKKEKKIRRPRARRDLGSFRPTSARIPAPAQVNVLTVPASMSWRMQQSKENLSGFPSAFASLSEVHHHSPPSSKDGGGFWTGRSFSRPQDPVLTKPTYADIAASQAQHPGDLQQLEKPAGISTATAQMVSAAVFPYNKHGTSSDDLRNKDSSVHPSPLASEYALPRHKPHSVPDNGFHATSPYISSPSSGYTSSHSHRTPQPSSGLQYVTAPTSDFAEATLPRYINESFNAYYQPPHILGPNLSPLPLDEAISVTPKRRLPSDFHNPDNIPTPPSQHLSQSPRSQPRSPLQQDPHFPVFMPTGYYSQPMTRDTSHQSRDSAAETEPIGRYPSSSQVPAQGWNTVPFGSSPRDRLADGRPLRKSPKTSEYASPVYPESESPNDSPLSRSFSGAGGWVLHSSPVSSVNMGNIPMSMSRSSSGPGVALIDPNSGQGLGIVHFNNTTEQVQFGEHLPISLEAARRRTWEHEQRLREREREFAMLRDYDGRRREGERGSGGSDGYLGYSREERTPYPNINLMPRMGVDLDSGGRRRGNSAPEREDSLGRRGIGVAMDLD